MRKLFAIFWMLSLLVLPRVILADTTTTLDANSTGLNTTASQAYGDNFTSSANNKSLSYFIGYNIIQPVFGIVGLLFFVLMVYAGVLWMTARGDTKQVDKAKGILTTAVIGAVIIASAYVLTNAVFNALLDGSVDGTGA